MNILYAILATASALALGVALLGLALAIISPTIGALWVSASLLTMIVSASLIEE